MVKGILNAMGMKPGETVLDPMMGSGTTLVEASLMGVHAIGFDVSPFCAFMAQAKIDGFSVMLNPLRHAVARSDELFKWFRRLSENGVGLAGRKDHYLPNASEGIDPEWLEPAVWAILLLAYFDSVGFAERSSRQSPEVQFRGILERYVFVIEKLQLRLKSIGIQTGQVQVLEGDARQQPLPDASVDGILFSPPYSFAVDYLENDAAHLGLLGANIGQLREGMVGLRGRTLRQKFDSYIDDMKLVFQECARLLKAGRCCSIVIGTNSNQLAKLFGTSPSDVEGLDDVCIRIAKENGFGFVRRYERRIVGMSNTMRNEDILVFCRPS